MYHETQLCLVDKKTVAFPPCFITVSSDSWVKITSVFPFFQEIHCVVLSSHLGEASPLVRSARHVPVHPAVTGGLLPSVHQPGGACGQLLQLPQPTRQDSAVCQRPPSDG